MSQIIEAMWILARVTLPDSTESYFKLKIQTNKNSPKKQNKNK